MVTDKDRAERAREALDLWENTPGMSLDMAFVIYGRREAAASFRDAAQTATKRWLGEWLLHHADKIEAGEQPLPEPPK